MLPKELGISEIIPGCVVTNMDYEGVGVAVIPRAIGVRIDDYVVSAYWRGTPVLAVGNECLVAHSREGEIYEVLASSGASSSSVAELYLHVWVYDISLGVLIAYDTIVGAAGYAALASGDLILIPPDPPTVAASGAYDESVTLVDGVKFVEMVPGSVIINSTSANVAVTCVDGGYINVKEIRATRGAGNNAYAVDISGLGVGEECEIHAEDIVATQTGGTGGEAAIAIYGGGAGTLYVYADHIESYFTAVTGGSNNHAVYVDGDTVYAWADLKSTFVNGGATISWTLTINAESGNVYVRGHVEASEDDYTVAAYANYGLIKVWGDCVANSTETGAFAFVAGVECDNDGVAWVFGNCSATGKKRAFGVFILAGAGDTATGYVYGRCYGETTDAGATEAAGGMTDGIGSPVLRIHGDAVGVDIGGVSYGCHCDAGTLTHTCGRASGVDFDEYRSAGTLQVFMVEYDSYSGAITSYYPLPDTGYIGEAGGATGRITFDFTGGTDYINFASAHVGINEAAPGAMQQITIDNAAVIGLIIKEAAGQTANTFQIQSSAAAVLTRFTADGYLGIGADPGTTYSIRSNRSVTNPTAHHYGIYAEITKNVTVAPSNWIFTGLSGRLQVSGNANETGTNRGFQGTVSVVNSATVSKIACMVATAVFAVGFGTVNDAYVNEASATSNGAGNVINLYHYWVKTPSNVGGAAFTNIYGLYVEDQAVAANNWAIYTNLGNVRFGDSVLVTDGAATAADRLFQTEVSDAVTGAITYSNRISHTTSGAAAALFGVGEEHELEDSAGNMQVASEQVTLWATSTSGSESPLLRFTTYPTGSAGPGYSGFWTWNDLDNNARTVIPNGAGDVTAVLAGTFAINESGGVTAAGPFTVDNNSSVDLYDDGTDVFTLTVAADGSVTVARSAGASTCDIALHMVWI